MKLMSESQKVINNFKNVTDCGDIYVIIRVLKKYYDFSKENSILLIPISASSTYDDYSIYNTVIENDICWKNFLLEGMFKNCNIRLLALNFIISYNLTILINFRKII